MTARRRKDDKDREDDPLAEGARLHARSTYPIVDRVDDVLRRLKSRGLKFRGRIFKLEPFLNVLVLDYLALPEAEQNAIMERGGERLAAMLSGKGGYGADFGTGPARDDRKSG